MLRTKLLGTICNFFSSQYGADEPGVKYFLLFPVSTQESTRSSALNMHDLPEFLQEKICGKYVKAIHAVFSCSSSN